jgi:nucleoside-diphosphate-sugar epimerase
MGHFVLTGATGFLGGRLAAALLARGHTLTAVLRSEAAAQRLHAAQPPTPALRTVVATPAGRFEALDDALDAAADGLPPAAVLHLAACYGRAQEDDAALDQANVELPLALLDWAARRRAGGCVVADTVLAADASRYAASKAHARTRLQARAAAAALPVIDLRLEHLYGPGDAPERFVPWLAGACRAGSAAVPLGSGRQQREFVHVDDAVDACLRLLAALPHLGAGWRPTRVSGEPTSVRALAEAVHAITASRATLAFGARPDRPAETDPDAPDDGLLRRLGWRRRIPLADGLRHTLTEASR